MMKNPFKETRGRLIAFSLVALASIYLAYFALKPALAVVFFKNIGYWTMTLTFGLFVFFVFRVLRATWQERQKSDKLKRLVITYILVAIGGSFLLYRAETPAFKMIMDDHVIAATSKQLHDERMPLVPIRSISINNALFTTQYYVDKRPIFFHYLASLVSDFTGYRPKNTVYLNVVLGVVLLMLVFGFGRSMGGDLVGIASVVLLASAPMVSHLASGGGMEVINIVMVVVTMWLGAVFVRKPNQDTFGAFTLSGILLAQSRYESVVFLLPVALTILAVWIRDKKIYLPDIAYVCPVLLIPYVLQHKVFQLVDKMWQMQDVTRGDTPFGFVYFFDNLGRALLFFFTTQPTFGNSALMSVAGCIALVAMLVFSLRHIKDFFEVRPSIQIYVIFLTGFIALFILLMLYSWEFDSPIIRRLGTPFFLPLTFGAAYFFFSLIKNKTAHIVSFLVIAVFYLVIVFPATSKRVYVEHNNVYHEFVLAEKFLKEREDERLFIISDDSAFFSLYDVEMDAWNNFSKRKEQIKYFINQPGSADLLLFRRLVWDPVAEKYVGTDRVKLDDDFVLETVWEDHYHEVRKVQFSRIVDVKGVEMPEPDKPIKGLKSYLEHWVDNMP